ncbi:neprilysin-2-like isoform X2 [Microplitis demolitor]|uniref:neprilysin-2-like isoform X2 n=1 Tax=Microplitis demolitor TaxID=69319 RepID=UPI00235B69C5|nr:neprilysin-2-like isoform X2 [Microplitis demolitor]
MHYTELEPEKSNRNSTMTEQLFNKKVPGKFIQNKQLFVIASVGLICFTLPIDISAAFIDATSSAVAAHKCTSAECNVERLETEIINYRDSSKNLCDNFYGFVCGNYKSTDITNDEDYLQKKRFEFLDHLIHRETSGDFKPYKLIHDLNEVCMDDNARGQQALDLMNSIIKSLGGWPIIEHENWKDLEFDWIDFTGNAKKTGYHITYFLDWRPYSVYQNKSRLLRYSAKLAPSYFEFATGPMSEIKKEIYNDYMAKIGRMLGGPYIDVLENLDAAYEFEKKLDEINHFENPKDTENMSIEELQKQWPSIDWNKFVEKTLMPFVDASEKPILTVWNPEALTKFEKLMNETPKRVQATYGMWKIVQYSLPYLTDEFREMQNKFQQAVALPELSRQQQCDKIVKVNAEYAVYYMYLDHYKSSVDTIKSIIESIRKKMIEIIRNSAVLNDDDKNKGVKVLTDMQVTIGPWEKLLDPHEVEKFYEGTKIDKGNFLQTMLNMNIFRLKKSLSNEIQKYTIPYDERRNPGVPSSYDNHLYIPAEMIPNAIFDNNRPLYMNYGTLGYYIAQTMFHFVADIGRKFGEDGKEIPNKQVDCFLHRGDNETDPEIRELMSRKSVEDVIAQYVGFRIAYLAYKDYVAEFGPELKLPELSYTPYQLFWISFGQSFCSAANEFDESTETKKTELNMFERLVMNMLVFIPEISSDFECSVGSNMNPENKCIYW